MSRIPEEIPERYQPEHMNNVVRRMGAAGWLAANSLSFVSGENLTVTYSEKGILKMRELGEVLKQYVPGLFDPSSGQATGADCWKLVLTSFAVARELTPPLNESESWAFIGLVAAYALKNQGPDGGR